VGRIRPRWVVGRPARGSLLRAPAFFVILGLTIADAGLGVIPSVRGALYGLGPVVLAIFAVAVFRLALTAARTIPQAIIYVLAAGAAIGTPLGIAAILVLAGAAGLERPSDRHRSRRGMSGRASGGANNAEDS
jgi:chromate transport protein ChrA